jgi:hypothetical protein
VTPRAALAIGADTTDSVSLRELAMSPSEG